MITITPDAGEKLRETLSNNEDGPYLRLSVQGGGCSGFQYSLMTARNKEEGDTEYSIEGIKVVIDPISACYVNGARIDFQNSSFVINNPNAKSTCGCGQSFKP